MIHHYKNGVRKVKLKKYREAIEAFTKAIEKNPKDVDSYFERAFAKIQIKDYRGAKEDFKFILKKDLFKKANDHIISKAAVTVPLSLVNIMLRIQRLEDRNNKIDRTGARTTQKSGKK